MFFEIATDKSRRPLDLIDRYVGPRATTCWIIGGGPTLESLPLPEINASPAPKFAMNLAGVKQIRPDFWTAYDPTARFHRSIYHDARIAKFLPAWRATDLVPETTDKVCDCPNTSFFDLEGRDYRDAIRPGQTCVLDWADSLIMAVDIAYRLGFRRLLLAGCDMRVRPSPEQLKLARRSGVQDDPMETLDTFVRCCEEAGVTREQLAHCESPRVYHFDEDKSLSAAISTDTHYWRISQALRQSRRTLTAIGLELRSVTPGSRLNDSFLYQTAEDAVASLHADWGDVRGETERGRYTANGPRLPHGVGPMRDIPPPRRDKRKDTKNRGPVFLREDA